jgi:hypothetical protein
MQSGGGRGQFAGHGEGGMVTWLSFAELGDVWYNRSWKIGVGPRFGHRS